MDEQQFAKAVRRARLYLEWSPYNGKTPGAAQAMALVDELNDDDSLEMALIDYSRRERWAWDTVSAMVQATLRNPFQPMSLELAIWVADVLAGKSPRPRGKGKRLANRDLGIAETIVLLCRLYSLKPTRRIRGIPECCAEGGSACDLVGAAAGMTYKAVERVWNEWGADAQERLERKGDDYALGRNSRQLRYWPNSEIK